MYVYLHVYMYVCVMCLWGIGTYMDTCRHTMVCMEVRAHVFLVFQLTAGTARAVEIELLGIPCCSAFLWQES